MITPETPEVLAILAATVLRLGLPILGVALIAFLARRVQTLQP